MAGVRGTAFYIKVEDPDNSYVCTCNGTLTQGKPDRKAKIRVTTSSRSGLLYHDNALIYQLAAKAGTRLVWGSGDENGY